MIAKPMGPQYNNLRPVHLAIGIMLRAVLIVFLVLFSAATSLAADYICKDVGPSWSWFGDHVALRITYRTLGAGGRTYETGTGVSFRGSPLGSREKRVGAAEFNAYGAGALLIRQADDGPPFRVCATATDMDLVPIFRGQF